MNITYMYRALCKNTVLTKQQQVKMGPSSDGDDSDESRDSTSSKEGSSSSMEETLVLWGYDVVFEYGRKVKCIHVKEAVFVGSVMIRNHTLDIYLTFSKAIIRSTFIWKLLNNKDSMIHGRFNNNFNHGLYQAIKILKQKVNSCSFLYEATGALLYSSFVVQQGSNLDPRGTVCHEATSECRNLHV
jgi:hypothetical protein